MSLDMIIRPKTRVENQLGALLKNRFYTLAVIAAIAIKCNFPHSYLVISSVLTALGVPGGTAASTFDDAYRDELSKSVECVKCTLKFNEYCTQNVMHTN